MFVHQSESFARIPESPSNTLDDIFKASPMFRLYN